LLVCRAIASGGTPPYTYLWTAQGTGLQILEGQGTEEVDVRVNAGASGSVSLLVTDETEPTPCTDSDMFAIPAQPLGVFNVTVSASSGAGNVSGTRDTMRFTATVEATATTPLPTPPPASIIIQAHRNIVGLNYTHQLTATLIPNLSPHKYQAQWDITRDMGKWSLQVEYPYESNTANFKIDKRSQIVQVANSWLGATAAQVGGNCNDFVGKVYNHVGLPLTVASTQAQYSSADTACAGDGCILFYSSINAPPGNVAHDAIEAGTQRININSNTTPGEPVVSEDITAGVLTVPVGVPYKTLIEHRSTVDLDKD
jgi:hypothetical protein